MGGVQNGGDDLGDFDAIGVGFEAEFDAVEIVFQIVGSDPRSGIGRC